MQVIAVPVTTNASGDATKLVPIKGRILSIYYLKSTYANTVDFTITTGTTLRNIWVESNVTASAGRCPRQPTHDNAGAALLYAAAGQPVSDYYWIDENLSIVVAQGGDTKLGTFYIAFDDG